MGSGETDRDKKTEGGSTERRKERGREGQRREGLREREKRVPPISLI